MRVKFETWGVRPRTNATAVVLKTWAAALVSVGMLTVGIVAQAAMGVVDATPVPEGLKGVPVPEPSNIGQFVANKSAAIRLGKALFWDMQVGNEGKTACASCHFSAGADTRTRNQVTPGLLRQSSPGVPNPDTLFTLGGPNYQLKAGDFPFHKFENRDDRDSRVVRTHNDATSSQGIQRANFVGVSPGASADIFTALGDPVFNRDGLATRRVEPRNSPTVINSVFNFRNFWDGRATFLFNGVSPFGPMDANARVYKTGATMGALTAEAIRVDNASLASLATGPALSDFEMAAVGRAWPKIGVRLLAARALAKQSVHATDSVLGSDRHYSGVGLNSTYLAMVQAAFKPEWWNSTARVTLNGANYAQPEANFSMFFGLAVQMYLATLVSDDAPFDRQLAGQVGSLKPDAAAGMGLFFGKGKCASCHSGAEFTNASVRSVTRGPLSRMVMGNGEVAVYDEGYYNTAVTKTLGDIGNGETNAVNRPMSLTKLAQLVGASEFERLIGIPANLTVGASERIAVNGAFKTPTLRNVELTAPYMHDGSMLTLEQVVEFYNRGGNHFQNNIQDVDADIVPLGLSAAERAQLVAFMRSLTDERVRYERAPFDHPQLEVPNGHAVGSNGALQAFNSVWAADAPFTVPAVGRDGLSAPAKTFQDNLPSETQFVSLKFAHTGKCMEVSAFGTHDGANVQQWSCTGTASQQWLEVATSGGFLLMNRHSGKCLDVAGVATGNGVNIQQYACHYGPNQVFNWLGNRLVAKHSGKCVNVASGGTQDGANVQQYVCEPRIDSKEDQLAKANVSPPALFSLVALHSNQCVKGSGWFSPFNGGNISQTDCVWASEKWQEVAVVGGFQLRGNQSGKCLQVESDSRISGAAIEQWSCDASREYQVFNWVGNRLVARSSGHCMGVSAGSTFSNAAIVQSPCTESNLHDQFLKR